MMLSSPRYGMEQRSLDAVDASKAALFPTLDLTY
jgi:hypothetical protein